MRNTTFKILYHYVRPEDVGILGALGDGVSAGTAATATSMLDVFDESRGVSFVTGADGTWQFNPSLGKLYIDGAGAVKYLLSM